MNVFVLFFACLLHFHLIFFSFKNIYIYIYSAGLGLSCGKGDLP